MKEISPPTWYVIVDGERGKIRMCDCCGKVSHKKKCDTSPHLTTSPLTFSLPWSLTTLLVTVIMGNPSCHHSHGPPCLNWWPHTSINHFPWSWTTLPRLAPNTSHRSPSLPLLMPPWTCCHFALYLCEMFQSSHHLTYASVRYFGARHCLVFRLHDVFHVLDCSMQNTSPLSTNTEQKLKPWLTKHGMDTILFRDSQHRIIFCYLFSYAIAFFFFIFFLSPPCSKFQTLPENKHYLSFNLSSSLHVFGSPCVSQFDELR